MSWPGVLAQSVDGSGRQPRYRGGADDLCATPRWGGADRNLGCHSPSNSHSAASTFGGSDQSPTPPLVEVTPAAATRPPRSSSGRPPQGELMKVKSLAVLIAAP